MRQLEFKFEYPILRSTVDLLKQKCFSEDYIKNRGNYIVNQATFCEYYVPISGDLGFDWGVIINPLSSRFGMLTFEHDYCGCPEHQGKEND